MMAGVTNPKVVFLRLWYSYSLNNTKDFLYGHLPQENDPRLLCSGAMIQVIIQDQYIILPISFSRLFDDFDLPTSDMADLSLPINRQCCLNLHPGKNEYRVAVAVHIVPKTFKTFNALLHEKSSYCTPGIGLIQPLRAGQY